MNEKLSGLLCSGVFKRRLKGKTDKRLWIFSSTDNRAFNYNSSYLFLYVRERLPHIRPKYVMNDPILKKELSDKYGEEYFIDTSEKRGMITALEAGVWFTSAGLPVYGFGLSDGRVIVNLWHGIPLKRIALSDPYESALQRLYFKKIFSDNYSFVITPSSRLKPVMAESFGVSTDRIMVFNEPRTDALHEDFDIGALLSVKYETVPEHKSVILYAPTHRDGAKVRLFPFPDFDIRRLDEFLCKEKAIILVRAHSYDQDVLGDIGGGRVIPFNEDIVSDITQALCAVDVLVTDYSSIYLEYLLLERPMIFLPYDLDMYSAKHGFNFDYEEVTPGEKPGTLSGFIEALRSAMSGDFDRQEVKRIREYFYESDDAGCPAICEYVESLLETK